MSDEDDFNDLPPISLNSSRDEGMFVMPPADELAAQRRHEERLEQELRNGSGGQEEPTRPAHGDSGESDKEDRFATAVSASLVQSGVGTRRRLPARDVIAAVLDNLLPPYPSFLEDFRDTLIELRPPAAEAMIYEWAVGVGELVSFERERWSWEEVSGVGLWVCAALLWAEPPAPRPLLARTLRALLDDRCDADQVRALSEAWCAAFGDCSARLAVYGAVAGARGAGGCALFADRLLGAALAAALHVQEPVVKEGLEEAVRKQWPALGTEARLVALRALGQAMARGWLESGLLDALATPAATRRSLDRLKVSLMVSKLRCLFLGERADGAEG